MSCMKCGDSCVGGCDYTLPVGCDCYGPHMFCASCVKLSGGTTMSAEDRCSCGPGEACWYCGGNPLRTRAGSTTSPTPTPNPMKPTAATIRAQIEKAKRDIDDAKYARYEARVWSEIRSMLALSKLEGHINLDRDCDSIGDRLWREVEAAGYRLDLRYLRLTITVPEAARDD